MRWCVRLPALWVCLPALRLFHRVRGEHGIVVPLDDIVARKGSLGMSLESGGNVDEALVGGPAEAKRYIVLRADPWAVHQYVQAGENAVHVRRSMVTAVGELLPGATAVHPDVLFGVGGANLLEERRKGFGVLGFGGFATQHGKPVYVKRGKRVQNLLLNKGGELFAGLETPGLLVEATGAVEPASRYEETGAHADSVGDVAEFYGRVIHESPSNRSSRSPKCHTIPGCLRHYL